MSVTTWGDIYRRHLRAGEDHGAAAFAADEWVKKRQRKTMNMEKTPWYPANTHPVRMGLYERDWRETDVLPEEDRTISLDLWEPVTNKLDSLYPGVWYVSPGWNDASYQHLPWRGIVKANGEVRARAGLPAKRPSGTEGSAS